MVQQAAAIVGCHSLRGSDGLGQDAVAQLRLHRVPHDQIHTGIEDLFQAALDARSRKA
jgi:hypothetical protein